MVPSEGTGDTYLVLEDLGRFGRVGARQLKRKPTMSPDPRALDDHYIRPMRIVAFNTAEGWSRMSLYTEPTSFADDLRSPITCRSLWRSSWIWQGAKAQVSEVSQLFSVFRAIFA
jgi:hypothetical protein